MPFSQLYFPRPFVSRTTTLGFAFAGLCALTMLPANAQVGVTNEQRYTEAEGGGINETRLRDDWYTDGVYQSTESLGLTDYMNAPAGQGFATATQFTNISDLGTLLDLSGSVTSTIDSQLFPDNPSEMNASTNFGVTFTLDEASQFSLFGSTSVSPDGGSLASFGLVGVPTNSTGFSFIAAPNMVFQESGILPAGTYNFGAYTSAGGAHTTSNSSITFDFAVAAVGPPPPPSVPEASTTVSFGLLLAFGLGGLVVEARKKKAAAAF